MHAELHLVAAIALLIALGGAVAMLHSLRDSVLPTCYEIPGFEGPVVGPGIGTGIEPGIGEDLGEVSPIPPIELPEDFGQRLVRGGYGPFREVFTLGRETTAMFEESVMVMSFSLYC